MTEETYPIEASGCWKQTSKTTWRDKLRFKMFPATHCDLPEAPATHKDCLTVKVRIELAFIARLRVLVSGRIMCETKTVTENIIGGCVTASAAYPLPPKSLEKKETV